MSSPVISRPVTKKSAVVLIVISALALFIAVSAVPRYISGWPWANPLKVHNQSELQAIRDQGIALPGWISQEQATTKIGGDSWSIQQLALDQNSDPRPQGAASTVLLLLRPQIWEADQPEVEWLDIKGFQRWKTDSLTKLPFEMSTQDSETVRIKADFFRAWSKEQTYAVLQWYASPVGGSASPAWWFWADQGAQWRHRQRLPWVAVSVWLPIDPLSAIAPHQETAISLGKAIQSRLEETAFSGAFSDSL
ncbi:MAG: cyanoexosortase B system-associated protein [Cyanobacteria bacterium J06559_1]